MGPVSRLSRPAFLETSGAITASAFGLTTIAGCGLVSAQPQLKRLGWLCDDCRGELVYLLTAFRDGLREVGWVEVSIFTVRALMQASRRLPIIMADVLDPVANGLAANLARPGGNVTGTTVIGAGSGRLWG